MLLKIAWRNIWRNKIRSVVVIIAIALGLWAGIFASGFVVGLMNQKVDSVIKMEMSHFQVHEPGFRDEFKNKLYVKDAPKIIGEIKAEPETEAVTGRVISLVMVGTATKNGSLKLNGIVPEDEDKVTALSDRLVEGEYFEGIKRNPILISKRTAEDYKVKLRSKIIVTLQDMDGEITAGAFRVAGIFDSKNGLYDDMNAFVRQSDLQELMGIGQNVHEIAVLLNEHDQAEPMAIKYQEAYPDHEVMPWMDLSTGMRMMIDMMDMYTLIIVGIILFALLFSIVNTMLMAILERVKELGVLMAVGMTKPRVFGMVMLETIFLTLVGAPIGLLISWLSIAYFGSVGIVLDNAAYEDMGFANVVYPQLEAGVYMEIALMVVVMAIFAALFPARKALKLNPVESIRKI